MRKLIPLVFAIAMSCGYGYSVGARSGTVTKFSYKGFVWKSWEGELVMGGTKSETVNGVAQQVANVWAFHVQDPAIVAKIQDAQSKGTPVTLEYEQWACSPVTQDSDYDVVGVK